MDADEKIHNQDAFMSDKVRIIVATSAFGMGVDKSDVGLVIHYDISDSLENYVQEAGRAGRDPHLNAKCYVLYSDEDLDKHFILLNQTKLSISEIQQVWKAVKDFTKQRPHVSCSALEIARQAGWDDSVSDIETRVRTALSALEQSGYIEEWGEIEGIYQYAVELEIAGIVMNEVMTADIVNLSFLQELVQCRLRCLVKGGSVITQCSDVVYFMVFQSHFGIHEVEHIIYMLCHTQCTDGCEYCNRMLDIHHNLKQLFGYDAFRTYDGEPLQEQASQAAVDGKSLLAIFPTGGGKSLTFQLPALIDGRTIHGLTVVISPLQSLMKDQVDNLADRGFTDAVTINGLLDPISRSQAIKFTPMQHQLMQLFFNNTHHQLSKQEICDALWPKKPDASETLYTLIRRIKPVIEQNSNLMIESERGKSYRLIIR
jgi:superfamily II DNA helicase RecQ